MDITSKELCRFCLKTIRDPNFHIIKQITLEILDVLLIEMDMTVGGNALICSDCQEGLERCFNFKSICISSEDSIAKSITQGFKLDLEEHYLKKKLKRKSMSIPRDHKICRLCMKISATVKCLNDTDELVAFVNDTLHKYIPELNLNAVKNPVICETCLLSLQSYSEFVAGCLDVEKKINRYCEVRGVAKTHAQLYNVLQFTINEALECDIREYPAPKNTEKLDESKSNIQINCKELSIKLYKFDIKTEEIMLKSEDDTDSCCSDINYSSETGLTNGVQIHSPEAEQCNLHEDMSCDKNGNDVDTEEKPEIPSLPRTVKEETTDNNQLELFTKHNGKESSKGSIIEESVAEHYIKNEEIEIKSEDAVKDNRDEVVGKKIYGNRLCCQLCTFTNRNKRLFNRHLLIHSPVEVINKCKDCSFMSKAKSGLKLHTLKVHGHPLKIEEFKCKICRYKNRHLGTMKAHELTHLPASERPKFKCLLCDFHCFNKWYFKEHQKIHTESSESTWHKCAACSFKTLHRGHYNQHMRVHKSIPEAELFHCAHCPYKTKLKEALRLHLLKHRDKSEIITFNCDKCPYKAKYKSRLTTHMKIHKTPLEHEFYKCESCDYRTTGKRHLQFHILQHKDKSEIQMYRCDACTFETKHKYNLQKHKKIIHADPAQIKMYKCEICPYQSKTKRSLKSHSLIHKSLEDVPTYKCFHCSYQAKYKGSLTVHVQIHLDESRRQKFKCEICGYEVKTKRSMKKHNNTCFRSR